MIIMDVGASFGEFAKFVSKLSGEHRVIAIEPNPKSAATIKRSKGIEVHEIALDNVNEVGSIILRISKNPELSSLSQLNPDLDTEVYVNHLESVQFSHETTVPVMSLKYFMKKENISTIDLLKIDAQGKDWDVVLSAGELIAKVKVLILEVCYEERLSLYENERDASHIIPLLDRLGFSLVWLVPNGGGEANMIAYNRVYGFENYIKVQNELMLLKAPCLKLNPEPLVPMKIQIRRKLWFVERRLRQTRNIFTRK